MNIKKERLPLIKQAVDFYNELPKENFRTFMDYKRLAEKMSCCGWKTRHDGADKFTAIKESIVAKWPGKKDWSHDPIKDELEVYALLKKAGASGLVPRIYYKKEDFIIQERLTTLSRIALRNQSLKKIWIFECALMKIKDRLKGRKHLGEINPHLKYTFGNIMDLHIYNIGYDQRGCWKIFDGAVTKLIID